MPMGYPQAMGYYPPGPNMPPNMGYRGYPQMRHRPRFMGQQQIVPQPGMPMGAGMQNPMMIRPGMPVQGMRGNNQGRGGRGNQGRGKQQYMSQQQARNMPQMQQASASGAQAAAPAPAVHTP